MKHEALGLLSLLLALMLAASINFRAGPSHGFMPLERRVWAIAATVAAALAEARIKLKIAIAKTLLTNRETSHA